MSILIKGNNGSSVGGGSSKGFPPGDITNISIRSVTRCVLLNFSDPDSSIYNNITLSTWNSTIIVRKEGLAPTSIKDGDIILTNTIKNKYKDDCFTDSNVEVGKTYYYRFYTMSTDKVYNDSTSMIRSVKVSEADSILKNNTWEQINAASKSGIASSLWKVGDEIDIKISKSDVDRNSIFAANTTVTLQIWDFNHFDKSDGSGKAGILFGTKYVYENYANMNDSYGSYGGWNNSTMKRRYIPATISALPENLLNVIKEVNTYTNAGAQQLSDGPVASKPSSRPSIGKLSKDKLFVPGFTEVFGSSIEPDQTKTESNQKKFSIFTDDNSRIKKMNAYGDAKRWWTRSGVYDDPGDYWATYTDGTAIRLVEGDFTGEVSVCLCFNV